MADDRPRISGYVPAAGAPLTSRTLALRSPESLQPGPPPTWADQIASRVYNWAWLSRRSIRRFSRSALRLRYDDWWKKLQNQQFSAQAPQ
jgi:hypothetical protein